MIAVDATGIDRAEFLIAPNLGESLKPLSKIASGGETARLTLALKSILSEVDQTPTLLFDEIDVGVGGRSGQVVGEKLYALGKDHQVIAITHLPQIAAFADAHFQIVKSAQDERVVSTVRELSGAEREIELAAMLDGMPVGKAALRNAQEMLARAECGETAANWRRGSGGGRHHRWYTRHPSVRAHIDTSRAHDEKESRAMGVNMKMIQQMQTRLEKVQRELAETVVEGSSGGGVVKAQVTGAREFRAISIDPSVVDPDDVDVLEDLITVAIQDAMNRATTLAEDKMSALTGGMRIPGLM